MCELLDIPPVQFTLQTKTMRANELTGQVFGRWTVLRRAKNNIGGQTKWRCRCTCGTLRVVAGSSLRGGLSKSCGCLAREVSSRTVKARCTTHGMSKTKVFRIWTGMLDRCLNPNTEEYHRYGGRGITVCRRWRKFANFYTDMGDPPPGRTLDRKNNDKGYSPGNCRWATRKEQMRNRRCSRLITYQGKTATVAEWSEITGLTYWTIWQRLEAGWSIEVLLTRPARSRRK